MPDAPVLTQLNLVVADMDATLAFYRRLGLAIAAEPGAFHVAAALPNGLLLEFDTEEFARQWDTASHGASGGSPVLGFGVATRDAVDRRYADLTGAGYRGHQPPYDGFWGARYAIVDDPDGHPVGLMSPREPGRRFWPPSEPPRA